jgi:hypothetical protein
MRSDADVVGTTASKTATLGAAALSEVSKQRMNKQRMITSADTAKQRTGPAREAPESAAWAGWPSASVPQSHTLFIEWAPGQTPMGARAS